MSETVITKKKLIEVALPLDAISEASATEKQIRVGKPTNLHLWWARRPLAAARAVIFAQMVDDPSANPDLFPTERAQEKERERLFKIIEEMVLWENTNNEAVLERAREEIWQSWRRACAENADHPRAKELFNRHVLPAFHDPFCGGGSLPLEAQRLGLEAHASDLNPVAVLITKAMIEIPPKFAGRPPANPKARGEARLMQQTWRGAQGLAEDVRYYGQWMRDEAERRIGHLYPRVRVTDEMVRERPDLELYKGRDLTVIAWLWARTVKSPNPAFAHVDVPLVSTFMLSTKQGKEAYVEPVIESDSYRFEVKIGAPPDPAAAKEGTKAGRGSNFRCLMSETPVQGDYIKAEGRAGRIGARLMAIVGEGDRGRVYLAPTSEHQAIAGEARPEWQPEGNVPARLTGGTCVPYGLDEWWKLFTPRQLVALTTFSDLVTEAREQARVDALEAGLTDDGVPLGDGGTGALAYAEAVSVYLALALSRTADWNNSLSRWENKAQVPQQLFGRQAIPMLWDYAEANPLSASTGSLRASIDNLLGSFARFPQEALPGFGYQSDAITQRISSGKVISTDPPYYDNIGYADLSDFFYAWQRPSLRHVFPDEYGTLTVPKSEELVATPYRHGNKDKADEFFLNGMTAAMRNIRLHSHPSVPVTIYYALKQSETSDVTGATRTGWETFLKAVIESEFSVVGTWPLRTENNTRLVGQGTNALASSIVLVCRPRAVDAPTATRREYQHALRAELPEALKHLQKGNIAPVDLAQASIGPGMAVFTRYREVLNADGTPMSVREALGLINATLDEVLAEQEGDFDEDSRWALTWFEQSGYSEGDFDQGAVLARAKNTSVDGMREAGIVAAGRGKVRLLRPAELVSDWDPDRDRRLTVWETTHQLIRALESGGEPAAAALVTRLGSKAEVARELAYRLYIVSERKKRAADALSYNGLVQSWPEIVRLSREPGTAVEAQGALGLDGVAE